MCFLVIHCMTIETICFKISENFQNKISSSENKRDLFFRGNSAERVQTRPRDPISPSYGERREETHASRTCSTAPPPASHYPNLTAFGLDNGNSECGLDFSRDCQRGSHCSHRYRPSKGTMPTPPAGWTSDHHTVSTRTTRRRSPLGISVRSSGHRLDLATVSDAASHQDDRPRSSSPCGRTRSPRRNIHPWQLPIQSCRGILSHVLVSHLLVMSLTFALDITAPNPPSPRSSMKWSPALMSAGNIS